MINKSAYHLHRNDTEYQDGRLLQKEVEQYTESRVKVLTRYLAGHHIQINEVVI